MKAARTIDRLEVALLELDYAVADYLASQSPRDPEDNAGPDAEATNFDCVRLALTMAIDMLTTIAPPGPTSRKKAR